jgi:hypothetical protein
MMRIRIHQGSQAFMEVVCHGLIIRIRIQAFGWNRNRNLIVSNFLDQDPDTQRAKSIEILFLKKTKPAVIPLIHGGYIYLSFKSDAKITKNDTVSISLLPDPDSEILGSQTKGDPDPNE